MWKLLPFIAFFMGFGCLMGDPKSMEEPQPNFDPAYMELKGASLLRSQSHKSFEEYRAKLQNVISNELIIEGRVVRVSAPTTKTAKTLPLVISLHGMGGNIIYQNHLFNAARFVGTKNFVLAIPSGIRRAWDLIPAKSRDRDYLLQMIEKLKEKYPINPDKVYLVGHSNGGIFALNFACKIKGIAGIVSIGGLANYFASQCIKNPHNVTIVHGLEDEVVKYSYGRYTFRRLGKYNLCDTSLTHTEGLPIGLLEHYKGCASGVKTEMYTLTNQTHGTPVPIGIVDRILTNLLQEKPQKEQKN